MIARMGRAKNLGHEARARTVGAERAAVRAARAGARVRPRSLVAITPRVSPSDGLAPAGVVPARRARRRVRERRAGEARGGPTAVRRVRRVRQQLRRERDTVHRTIHAPHDLHTRRRRPHAPTPRPLARRRSPRLGSTRARPGASPSSRLVSPPHGIALHAAHARAVARRPRRWSSPCLRRSPTRPCASGSQRCLATSSTWRHRRTGSRDACASRRGTYGYRRAPPSDPNSHLNPRTLPPHALSSRRMQPDTPRARRSHTRGWHHAQGDNSADSTDSRTYGPVPIALLQSVVVRKLWPLSDAGAIRDAPAQAHSMGSCARASCCRCLMCDLSSVAGARGGGCGAEMARGARVEFAGRAHRSSRPRGDR